MYTGTASAYVCYIIPAAVAWRLGPRLAFTRYCNAHIVWCMAGKLGFGRESDIAQ